MKLKQFNPENCQSERIKSSKPCIGITLKGGLFRINKGACELLELKEGDNVVFLQDEEDTECWYIEKVKKGQGFELRSKASVTPGLLFNNTKLVKEIFESLGINRKAAKMLMAGKPTTVEKRKLYGLLSMAMETV